jgi:translation elongation factor EF-Tu-like GTPase
VKPFEMAVEDTFHFENDSTAFAGMIETESDFTGPCDCEVILGNEVKTSICIDGEMMVKRNKTPDRAISTTRSIDLTALGLERGGFII